MWAQQSPSLPWYLVRLMRSEGFSNSLLPPDAGGTVSNPQLHVGSPLAHCMHPLQVLAGRDGGEDSSYK